MTSETKRVEKDYDSFVLGFMPTPLGFVGYIDCMREGEDIFDRAFLIPKVFPTEDGVKSFLETIANGMQKEFGTNRVSIT